MFSFQFGITQNFPPVKDHGTNPCVLKGSTCLCKTNTFLYARKSHTQRYDTQMQCVPVSEIQWNPNSVAGKHQVIKGMKKEMTRRTQTSTTNGCSLTLEYRDGRKKYTSRPQNWDQHIRSDVGKTKARFWLWMCCRITTLLTAQSYRFNQSCFSRRRSPTNTLQVQIPL